MYWSLNKISVYGDRVHGEAVPVSSQLIRIVIVGYHSTHPEYYRIRIVQYSAL